MKRYKLKPQKAIGVILLLGLVFLLGACSRIASVEIPPLPTPGRSQPEATADIMAEPTLSPITPPPVFSPAPTAEIPAPTLPPTPAPVQTPLPTPTPEPVHEDPNTPHLRIENATLPQNMEPYGIVDLHGEIYTDKGVIAQVCGRIYNNDTGQNDQICMYYPYEPYFSLAGTVNSKLIFGVLEPGHYSYIVSAIAENNSFSSGEQVLIEHAFEIYYP